MKIFYYTAVDEKNAFIKGKIEAKNSKKALALLEQKGLLVVNIKADKTNRWAWTNNIFNKISRLDKIFFTRHLYTMLESGIALDQAVKITAEQVDKEKFREVLLDIFKRLRKGQPFHQALSYHSKYFPNYYISLVKVGEKSGKLDEVLSHLLEQQEADYELITKTRGAMIYPAVIVSALIIMVTFMMIFVIPKITSILTEYGVDLPLTTKILIWISNNLINYGIFLIPLAALLFYLFKKWVKTEKGKWLWDSFLLKMPTLNKIVVKFNLARFSRSLSALLKSGVSIDQALDLTSEVSNHSHYKKSLQSGINFVQRGIPLTEVLVGYPKLYPPITTRMVEVGERAGKLDYMLNRLAKFYEKSVTTTIQNLTSVIEPVLLITVGLGVAFVAVSVLLPIWRFTETI